jgi:glycosyltransferase involved in cell wall biosynthesis
MTTRKSVLFGVSDVISANYFLKEFIAGTRREGFDVSWFAGGTVTPHASVAEGFVHIPTLHRAISVGDDFRALRDLVRLIRRERPVAVHISTPKAALLGSLAAFVCRVPRRVYLVRGLRLETASGPSKALLWFLEWLTGFCATDILCVSQSVMARCIEMKLAPKRKMRVLGPGSSCGVETARFTRNPERLASGLERRRTLGIPDDHVVFGYVGRLNKAKGVEDLFRAFEQASATAAMSLMCVGELEPGEVIDEHTQATLRTGHNVHWVEYMKDPAPIYHAFDVLVLPTHREGFPNVVLEAGSAGLPVITTTATGAIDAVVDGVTGILVPPRDPVALADAIAQLEADPDRRRALGDAGQRRCEMEFERTTVISQHIDHLIGHMSGRR